MDGLKQFYELEKELTRLESQGKFDELSKIIEASEIIKQPGFSIVKEDRPPIKYCDLCGQQKFKTIEVWHELGDWDEHPSIYRYRDMPFCNRYDITFNINLKELDKRIRETFTQRFTKLEGSKLEQELDLMKYLLIENEYLDKPGDKYLKGWLILRLCDKHNTQSNLNNKISEYIKNYLKNLNGYITEKDIIGPVISSTKGRDC
ncbi:MAG: hypothetical protein PHC66_02425 [Candidatus Nanoarchaeia archaeon]|nr:hypothetical protein [Candidatus Nanoarchaeia archaeon]MDD5239490.1 hypothetical protein [Candidatus Nanoarchaeia archaeon]